MMHFLGHRRSASQQSIDPETQQQPQQQWRPHHKHRLSASSALYQAAQALGSIGVPTAAATANAATANAATASASLPADAATANSNSSHPLLPNPVPSSSAVSSHSQSQQSSASSQYSQPSPSSPQQQRQHHRQSGYFQPNHNHNHNQPPLTSGPVSSPQTSSLQYTPGAASATKPATGSSLPNEPPVANFRWDDEYYNTRDRDDTDRDSNPAAATTDSASVRSLQPHQAHSYSHSHSHSYAHTHSHISSNNTRAHSRSQSYSQQQQRASIPAALLPAHGLQPHRDSTYSLSARSTATETSGPPGLTPSIALFPDHSSPSPSSSSAAAAMNQQQQQQQSPPQFQSGTPRRAGTYSSQHEELHMPAGMMQHGQLSPREYSSSSTAPAAPHIKLDQASPNVPQYQNTSSVPNVLQPGGPGNRPPVLTANTAPALSTMQPQQPQDYQTPSKPPSLSLSHSYSRSSPAAGYEGASTFAPYTPTTPSGSGSQFMSPPDQKYNAPGSQRNISNTPLGLADIRPRADSSMSDGVPGSVAYELANAQPGTSNYLAPWALYAFDWCKWPPQGHGAGKLAVGSYLEDGHNYIQILDTQMVPTPNDVYQPGTPKFNLEFSKVAEATHSYPVTRLLWEPPSSQKQSTDLLATSGDHLRLWSLPSESPVSQSNSITRQGRDTAVTKLTPLALLSNSKTPDHTAPLTSLDWNTVSPSLIITSSIDTTCTIWDIPSLTAKTQLIAHDKEVYDVRFCANSVDVFVSCGQDGSVRMFDLRSLEHSTIIYEPTGKDDRDANGGRISPTLAQQTMSNPPPLLRLATSPHDTHLLATFAQDSNVIRILDVRHPGQALLELRGHGGSLNSIEWSPTRRGVLASGADDCQVLLWDVYNNNHSLSGGPPANGAAQPDNTRSPYASWQCDYEVGNLAWVPHLSSNDQGEWLGVSAGRGLWGVKTCGRTGA
ncbi:WD repeat domain-containing protein [Colletotrichum higginsianum IMI 349063]|uniref:WD repeat domain-containing protein n=3 Tax=Colletotrichum higginsianum TaxID=80884 RepID=A0A1B7XT97_COLHI|nr:WD repeat domain-containing protein [Colletotrichum higginsianum IMI 349063]OBR02954.1 WD repeat domain-containing protein [Colletotrichum higginsianum IMI 349063]